MLILLFSTLQAVSVESESIAVRPALSEECGKVGKRQHNGGHKIISYYQAVPLIGVK